MTTRLYEQDAYRRSCDATVVAVGDGAVVLDQTVFYAAGGGQPGDTGRLVLADGLELTIVDTQKSDEGIRHIAAPEQALPRLGDAVTATIDWERRYRHMRMHTCLHLLCSLVDAPVTGGNLGAERGRLDFDLPEPTVDKATLTAGLNRLIATGVAVSVDSIADAELDARPELVRTLAVAPPRGTGSVRLIDIAGVDVQPCGGTHVANVAEIGAVRVAKIEKKSAHNRRIAVVFDEP